MTTDAERLEELRARLREARIDHDSFSADADERWNCFQDVVAALTEAIEIAKRAEARVKVLEEALTTIRSKVKRIDTLLASNEPTGEESFALPLKLCSRVLEFIDGPLTQENEG